MVSALRHDRGWEDATLLEPFPNSEHVFFARFMLPDCDAAITCTEPTADAVVPASNPLQPCAIRERKELVCQ